MCVTFTGCELLCSETLNPQQLSHATLKPKLQVQIKMMVMKDKNAKACWGFVWIKPTSDWDRARGVWWSREEWGRPPSTSAEALGEETQACQLHPPHGHSLSSAWEKRRSGPPADGSGSRSSRWLHQEPSAKRVLPQGRWNVGPMFAIELNQNKDEAEHQC